MWWYDRSWWCDSLRVFVCVCVYVNDIYIYVMIELWSGQSSEMCMYVCVYVTVHVRNFELSTNRMYTTHVMCRFTQSEYYYYQNRQNIEFTDKTFTECLLQCVLIIWKIIVFVVFVFGNFTLVYVYANCRSSVRFSVWACPKHTPVCKSI
jgi:hypothetical protein